MANLDTATYLRMSAALKDRADQYAADHEMPFAAVVREALVQFLDRERPIPPSPRRPPADYVPYGERRPYVVADALNDLAGPTEGVVTLDRRLNWSGKPIYDLADPDRMASMYATVLSEAANADDLRAWLDPENLIGLWPTLNLPDRVRRMWEERFPELAEASTQAAA